MSHLQFIARPMNKGRKTEIFDVLSLQNGTNLGVIGFYAHWRKFIFQPQADTIFDAHCLDEISEFTRKQTQRWKESLDGRLSQ